MLTTCITDVVARVVAAPQGCSASLAIGTAESAGLLLGIGVLVVGVRIGD